MNLAHLEEVLVNMDLLDTFLTFSHDTLDKIVDVYFKSATGDVMFGFRDRQPCNTGRDYPFQFVS